MNHICSPYRGLAKIVFSNNSARQHAFDDNFGQIKRLPQPRQFLIPVLAEPVEIKNDDVVLVNPELYNKYHGNSYDAQKLEEAIVRLMQDEDVTAKRGIYEYLLSGDERHLSIRAFSDNMKREAYERQQGICPDCGEHFDISEMEADHVTPWSHGGKTIAENCKMRCRECNRRKSDK